MKVFKHFLFIKILIATFAFMGLLSYANADESPWQDIKPIAKKQLLNNESMIDYQQARLLQLNQSQLQDQILNNNNGANLTHNTHISLPLPNGNNIQISLSPKNAMSDALVTKFPKINTFQIEANDQIIAGTLDLSVNGFHAMMQMRNGEMIFIDPIRHNQYASYQKSDQNQKAKDSFSCGAKRMSNRLDLTLASSGAKGAKAQNRMITYRIAIAASGEYTAKHGGTVEGAMAAINTTLSRINQVFERDLNIHLTLVDNNELLIHTDPQSDPYTRDTQVGLVKQNQAYIDLIIGNENYDIGHLFTASGGGLAAIGSVCNSYDKGKGISGINNPQNDSFNLDFVAHEIGHQLGATHTFNSSQGLCSGDSRSAISAFEPGSGSTIMSYAGYCGLDNLQSHTDAMFHIGSIKQIQSYTENGLASHCGQKQSKQNLPPILDAGKDYSIPARTPFELNGKATDSETDSLVYAWQQMDTGKSSMNKQDTGDNALFRVYMPNSNKNRVFPKLANILNHTQTAGETLPSTDRKLKFFLSAQDGHNLTQSDQMTVNVVRTGSRFALNLPLSQYTTGINYKLLWNVANTDQAPIHCQNIDISLSTDGGYHFDQTLAKNVANIGESWITIPADSPTTLEGRFKISCSDNIFFAVSFRDFVITDQTEQLGFIYDDEEQPEENLFDTEDSIELAASNNSNNIKKQSIGGGSINPYFIFALFIILFRAHRNKLGIY